jgi:hypothetical protein
MLCPAALPITFPTLIFRCAGGGKWCMQMGTHKAASSLATLKAKICLHSPCQAFIQPALRSWFQAFPIETVAQTSQCLGVCRTCFEQDGMTWPCFRGVILQQQLVAVNECTNRALFLLFKPESYIINILILIRWPKKCSNSIINDS